LKSFLCPIFLHPCDLISEWTRVFSRAAITSALVIIKLVVDERDEEIAPLASAQRQDTFHFISYLNRATLVAASREEFPGNASLFLTAAYSMCVVWRIYIGAHITLDSPFIG
jgi:hypothetical protein